MSVSGIFTPCFWLQGNHIQRTSISTTDTGGVSKGIGLELEAAEKPHGFGRGFSKHVETPVFRASFSNAIQPSPREHINVVSALSVVVRAFLPRGGGEKRQPFPTPPCKLLHPHKGLGQPVKVRLQPEVCHTEERKWTQKNPNIQYDQYQTPNVNDF